MDEVFDAVVVGSGFGGSVLAYRLAEAGRSVCLLERGKAYPPGSFPRSPHRMAENFWDPSEGLHGMFNIWSFDHMGAVVSSGLGGGSLIYANVLLRKDEKWFVDDGDGQECHWPVDRAALDPHYEAVEKMMAVQAYPASHAPYSTTPKMLAFHQAGPKVGLQVMLPPLAVTFGNPGRRPVPGEPLHEPHRNFHGGARSTCRLCGECDVGCNYGSKNTLDYTYISAAERLGADVRPRHEVTTLARQGDGFRVSYVRHAPEDDGVKKDRATRPSGHIRCKKLFLAAGSLGSTYLLLKNQEALPGLNVERLGRRFSGNGDLLTFALNARQLPGRSQPFVVDPSFGPVITSALRSADEHDGAGAGRRGFYIQNAGYPDFVNWAVQAADLPGALRRARVFAAAWVKLRLGLSGDADLSKEISDLLGDAAFTKSSQPMLGMGRDVPDGRFTLKDDRLALDWGLKRQGPLFDQMRRKMGELAEAMGAEFKDAVSLMISRVATVHPLGGCGMGRHQGEGVVDDACQAFGLPGLYVVCGAALPGPVGPNPSLTIAAVADRCASRLTWGAPPTARRPAPSQGGAWSTVFPFEAGAVLDLVSSRGTRGKCRVQQAKGKDLAVQLELGTPSAGASVHGLELELEYHGEGEDNVGVLQEWFGTTRPATLAASRSDACPMHTRGDASVRHVRLARPNGGGTLEVSFATPAPGCSTVTIAGEEFHLSP